MGFFRFRAFVCRPVPKFILVLVSECIIVGLWDSDASSPLAFWPSYVPLPSGYDLLGCHQVPSRIAGLTGILYMTLALRFLVEVSM